MVDNREQYRNEKWYQGCLLNNSMTKRWHQAVRDEVNHIEKCRAYLKFNGVKYSELIHEYASPDECYVSVSSHNEHLEGSKKVYEPENDKVWVNI